MIINPSQLKTILQNAGTYIATLSEEYNMYHYTALNTGMRQNEIFTLNERIIDITQDTVKIRTEKTNNIRTVYKNEIDEMLLNRCAIGIQPFMRITYFTLNLALKKAGLRNIKVNGAKPETTHLYRHNYCKQLYIKYNSIEIVADTVRISNAVASKYINSIIEQAD